MADQMVVFSDLIGRQIETDLDALESNMVPVKEVMVQLRGAIERTRARGVSDDDILETLRRNGIKIKKPAFDKLLREGRPGTRMNPEKAKRAADKLNGGGEKTPGPPGAESSGRGDGSEAHP